MNSQNGLFLNDLLFTTFGFLILPTRRLDTARKFAARCVGAQSRLACVALGIIGNRDDADDIVQQAITIAIEKNESFESDSHFVGWLAGIVRNCALNHRRKLARRNTQSTDPMNLSSVETKSDDTSPVNRSTGQLLPMQGDFDDQIHMALEQVSPKARSCLLLRTVEGLSYREISELMDIPEGTAMNLVHRSKKSLRELLSSNEELVQQKDPGDLEEGGHHERK